MIGIPFDCSFTIVRCEKLLKNNYYLVKNVLVSTEFVFKHELKQNERV